MSVHVGELTSEVVTRQPSGPSAAHTPSSDPWEQRDALAGHLRELARLEQRIRGSDRDD